MDKKLSIRIRKNNFMRVRKGGKTYKSIYEQLLHDYRKESMDKGYLRRPENKNFYLTNSVMEKNNCLDIDNIKTNIHKLFDEVKEDYKKHNRNCSWQKQTIPFLTGVISFSKGFMLDEQETAEFGMVLSEFIEETFSQKISFVIHRDETSLHGHFTMFNYNFNTHKTIGRNIDTSELQDKLFKYLDERDLTYGHQRGDSKKLTKAKHLEIMEAKVVELENQEEEIKENRMILKKNEEKLDTLEFENLMTSEENSRYKEENERYKEENKSYKEIGDTLMNELKNICEDIITMGEEEKGTNILKTAQRYFSKNQDERFNRLFEKAKKIKMRVMKKSPQIGGSK